MRCIQQDKGPGQVLDQVRGPDNKVRRPGLGSMAALPAFPIRRRPLTIPTDTHSGCRLTCEIHNRGVTDYTQFFLVHFHLLFRYRSNQRTAFGSVPELMKHTNKQH